MKPSLKFSLLASLLGALCIPAVAQEASGAGATSKVTASKGPGKATITHTRELVATVEAIDMAKREVTLKGPAGKVVPVTVSDEVRNLDQVKVGDKVKVKYSEALTLTLKKGGVELRKSVAASDAQRAELGQKPGGSASETLHVTADVVALNAKTQTVTLKGPQQTVDMHVSDPEQFKQIKVGDQVDADYTQAFALSVEPAK